MARRNYNLKQKMLKIRKITKQLFFFSSIFIATLLILIATSIYVWQTTDEGSLPAKTAVVLHAIDNNLVDLDINVRLPQFITGGRRGEPLLREDLHITTTPDVEIPLRIYRPQGDGPFPIVMYYHGGAFLEGFGDINTHDNIVRSLSQRTNSVVIAVGYRLAPSDVFPAAIEDSYAALNWAYENADTFNGDSTKISVVGDSAGGNIAAVMALMSRDLGGPLITSQVLMYPLTTFKEADLESREIYDSGYYLLSRQVMYRARDLYTPYEYMWKSPYASPLHADDLSELPPTLIITAEFDPLRDEGELYAERLAQFNVPVTATRYEGVMHGFISLYEVMHSGQYGLREVSQFLRHANQDALITPAPYSLQIKNVPHGIDRAQDQVEAFAIGAYLLYKTVLGVVTDD
ncbi:alpha/beta hydrolase [Evansella cellulosilytica]|uniref:Alpha/beta hydrolase fold-3 domain protein n=1 Tax=Evansella cellulosilytica (strain ATCC 21833 / DSM 2522 / FERM P-1141 / JCM 9156 / N-4) TaxID=649639 RepID=E6U0A1_EVAC2|nr:alpha/beta hydrolase [Evansella cellulosilytica]ADU30217.1 alpha/beta hydrolase fold-3 domain protein [Evansella cellulosilytica DSM 2522]